MPRQGQAIVIARGQMDKMVLWRMRTESELESQPGCHTRALAQASSILEIFSLERRPLAVKDAHSLMGLPKPTVSRLAAVLEQFG
jgi:hypothetical protein